MSNKPSVQKIVLFLSSVFCLWEVQVSVTISEWDKVGPIKDSKKPKF